MKAKILGLLLMVLTLTGCNSADPSYQSMNDTEDIPGKWKTEYVVYYTQLYTSVRVIYTDNEVYTCSFQGTNFLLEKDNSEEILSTTAPIKIRESKLCK